MAITDAERELTAVGISVAAGCKPCTSYHVKAARKAQVSDDAIHQAVMQGLYIRQAGGISRTAHPRHDGKSRDTMTRRTDHFTSTTTIKWPRIHNRRWRTKL